MTLWIAVTAILALFTTWGLICFAMFLRDQRQYKRESFEMMNSIPKDFDNAHRENEHKLVYKDWSEKIRECQQKFDYLLRKNYFDGKRTDWLVFFFYWLNIQIKSRSHKINWMLIKHDLAEIEQELFEISSAIKNERLANERIAKEKQRKIERSIELVKLLPKWIARTEREIAQGKDSPKANTLLNYAKAKFAEIKATLTDQESDDDWLSLHPLLTQVSITIDEAVSAHARDSWIDDDDDDGYTPVRRTEEDSNGPGGSNDIIHRLVHNIVPGE